MIVYELKWQVKLLETINQEKTLDEIGQLINVSFLASEERALFHKMNKFKNYSFCSFYPIEKEGAYLKGNVYTILIRTIDLQLARFFSSYLFDIKNQTMKGLSCEARIIPKRIIQKLYSLTPCVLKTEHGYWRGHLSFDELERRIKNNLIRKHNMFTGEKLDENFPLYTKMEILNKIPIKIAYKDIHLLGDKIELEIADDKISQQIAYMSLGTGLAEMNSAGGFGFVNYQFYKG